MKKIKIHNDKYELTMSFDEFAKLLNTKIVTIHSETPVPLAGKMVTEIQFTLEEIYHIIKTKDKAHVRWLLATPLKNDNTKTLGELLFPTQTATC